jgi:2-methylcitrate dehydratase PrpD
MTAKQCGAILTRRGILQGAGGLMTTGALRTALRAEELVSPVTAKLSAYMSEASSRALPDDILEKTKHHILDSFAAMISGTQLGPGQVAIRFARAHAGEKVATVVGSNVVCGAMEAALANGMLAHSDETDDYAPVGTHPGSAVVPATLATGEQFAIDGTRFVRSVTLGYDIAGRVAAALGGQLFNHDGHKAIHGFTGTFGAASAAGCAAGLDAQQMRWLLDYAAQQASGLAAWQRDTEHIEKSFVFAGMPARNGVTAALLVQLGGTGVTDIFSGADNFLQAFAPKADPAQLIDKLGQRYEVTSTNIKKWTVGGPIQAALDALEALLKRRPLEPDQVKQMIVRLGPVMGSVVNNREMPDICVQHMLAVMLIDKTASFAAAHDKARMQDPAILRQRAKIQLIFDQEIERNTEQREAIVEVTLTDGAQLREHTTAVRGTAANPMTREEVVAKCRDLITPVLGAATTAELIAKILDLENVKNIGELRPLLQRM